MALMRDNCDSKLEILRWIEIQKNILSQDVQFMRDVITARSDEITQELNQCFIDYEQECERLDAMVKLKNFTLEGQNLGNDYYQENMFETQSKIEELKGKLSLDTSFAKNQHLSFDRVKFENMLKENMYIKTPLEKKYKNKHDIIWEKSKKGSLRTQLSSPSSIDIDKTNNFVYITDTNNSRIQIFTEAGDHYSTLLLPDTFYPLRMKVKESAVYIYGKDNDNFYMAICKRFINTVVPNNSDFKTFECIQELVTFDVSDVNNHKSVIFTPRMFQKKPTMFEVNSSKVFGYLANKFHVVMDMDINLHESTGLNFFGGGSTGTGLFGGTTNSRSSTLNFGGASGGLGGTTVPFGGTTGGLRGTTGGLGGTTSGFGGTTSGFGGKTGGLGGTTGGFGGTTGGLGGTTSGFGGTTGGLGGTTSGFGGFGSTTGGLGGTTGGFGGTTGGLGLTTAGLGGTTCPFGTTTGGFGGTTGGLGLTTAGFDGTVGGFGATSIFSSQEKNKYIYLKSIYLGDKTQAIEIQTLHTHKSQTLLYILYKYCKFAVLVFDVFGICLKGIVQMDTSKIPRTFSIDSQCNVILLTGENDNENANNTLRLNVDVEKTTELSVYTPNGCDVLYSNTLHEDPDGIVDICADSNFDIVLLFSEGAEEGGMIRKY
ncbi:hypothetical protein LOD99_2979 [Oopsacas minuta]|uniref:Uncharacterized protein n=1 Tax=Oopsacas minuta TaxID=111878 RepID=A0AAV7JYV2_9METZ|nr:hypothetical protein LOD99_2979 [Oopsacas minuta]